MEEGKKGLLLGTGGGRCPAARPCLGPITPGFGSLGGGVEGGGSLSGTPPASPALVPPSAAVEDMLRRLGPPLADQVAPRVPFLAATRAQHGMLQPRGILR